MSRQRGPISPAQYHVALRDTGAFPLRDANNDSETPLKSNTVPRAPSSTPGGSQKVEQINGGSIKQIATEKRKKFNAQQAMDALSLEYRSRINTGVKILNLNLRGSALLTRGSP